MNARTPPPNTRTQLNTEKKTAHGHTHTDTTGCGALRVHTHTHDPGRRPKLYAYRPDVAKLPGNHLRGQAALVFFSLLAFGLLGSKGLEPATKHARRAIMLNVRQGQATRWPETLRPEPTRPWPCLTRALSTDSARMAGRLFVQKRKRKRETKLQPEPANLPCCTRLLSFPITHEYCSRALFLYPSRDLRLPTRPELSVLWV